MKRWPRSLFMSSCLSIGIVLAVVLLGVVIRHFRRAMPTPQFEIGQMVTLKLTETPGQIINYWAAASSWQYRVRTANHQVRTQTHLLDADGPLIVEPLATITLWEWELEPRARKPPR